VGLLLEVRVDTGIIEENVHRPNALCIS